MKLLIPFLSAGLIAATAAVGREREARILDEFRRAELPAEHPELPVVADREHDRP